MGHDQHCAPFGGEVLNDLHDFLLQFGIQRAGRLIKQKRLRLHAQRACNGGALLLAPRKLRGKDIAFVADPHLVQIGARSLFHLGRVPAQHGHRSLHHVLQDGQMGPQIELLKHHRQICADAQDLFGIRWAAAMVLALPAHRFPLEQHLALLAVFKQVAAPQKRRLARAGRPDQRHHVAAPCRDVHAFENLKWPIGFVQVADFDDGLVGQESTLW
mmetsp:Transcript_22562/g.36749  ORF Transcript_22562/g.36749 Transcript_22562/m.36749 type:complete len:215 (+) Transcript_22562:1237-1881(+)